MRSPVPAGAWHSGGAPGEVYTAATIDYLQEIVAAGAFVDRLRKRLAG
jgi:hypothetical protein